MGVQFGAPRGQLAFLVKDDAQDREQERVGAQLADVAGLIRRTSQDVQQFVAVGLGPGLGPPPGAEQFSVGGAEPVPHEPLDLLVVQRPDMELDELRPQRHALAEIALEAAGHQKPVLRPAVQRLADPAGHLFSHLRIDDFVQAVQNPQQRPAPAVPQVRPRRIQAVGGFFAAGLRFQKRAQPLLFRQRFPAQIPEPQQDRNGARGQPHVLRQALAAGQPPGELPGAGGLARAGLAQQHHAALPQLRRLAEDFAQVHAFLMLGVPVAVAFRRAFLQRAGQRRLQRHVRFVDRQFDLQTAAHARAGSGSRSRPARQVR